MGQHKHKNKVPKASLPKANKPLSFIDRVKRLELALSRMEEFASAVSRSNMSMQQKISNLWSLIGEMEVRNYITYEALKSVNERLNLVSILALKIAGKERMTEAEETNLFELLTQQSPMVGENGLPMVDAGGAPLSETSARLLDINEYVSLRISEYYATVAVCDFIRVMGQPAAPQKEQPATKPSAVEVGEKPRLDVLRQGSEQIRPKTVARFSASRGGLYLPEVNNESGGQGNQEGPRA